MLYGHFGVMLSLVWEEGLFKSSNTEPFPKVNRTCSLTRREVSSKAGDM